MPFKSLYLPFADVAIGARFWDLGTHSQFLKINEFCAQQVGHSGAVLEYDGLIQVRAIEAAVPNTKSVFEIYLPGPVVHCLWVAAEDANAVKAAVPSCVGEPQALGLHPVEGESDFNIDFTLPEGLAELQRYVTQPAPAVTPSIILIEGTSVSGLRFYGPFIHTEAARDYAEAQHFHQWEVAPLVATNSR